MGREKPGAPKQVVALVASQGHGGGIELYVDAVVSAWRERGYTVGVMSLRDADDVRPSARAKFTFGVKSLRVVMASPGAVVVAFHSAFVPIVVLTDLCRGGRGPRPIVFFYGKEIWLLSLWQRCLIQMGRLRLVAISRFAAGALAGARAGIAQVLAPGLTRQRFELMRAAGRRGSRGGEPPTLLSVFRLEDFEDKGGTVVVQAAEHLRRRHPDLRLIIGGLGPMPESLSRLSKTHPWLEVWSSPSDAELALLYQRASLFVLATRTRVVRKRAYTEGFGMVLLEAQLAGLAVVAPAAGGGGDAFVDGHTGRQVGDESAVTLAETIASMLADRTALAVMAANAAAWAETNFAPERCAERAERVLIAGRPGAEGR